MFARSVSIQLKPNSVAEFTRTLDKEVIALLRKQKGFKDEITLVGQDGKEVIAISVWDLRENAEAYHGGTFPEVLKILANVVEGTPEVRTYEVASSTLHQIVSTATA